MIEVLSDGAHLATLEIRDLDGPPVFGSTDHGAEHGLENGLFTESGSWVAFCSPRSPSSG